MISGYATSAGTGKRSKRFPKLAFGPLGRTGLQVSRAGFGGYRISAAVPAHAAALRRALEAGVNLIDTSANYADGGSEELIGEVMARMITSGRMHREEVVVVSKAGYLQGRNYAISRQRERSGRPFPELVPYAEGLQHCIHPEFLEDQLSRSLDRLRLETIDVYLLHNPEYFLGWAIKEGRPPDRARAAYLRRMETAFGHLEKEVARGRIRCYGVSSNTFPVSSQDPRFTCLEKIWQAAVSISAEHHFHVIQLPMNLFESGAVLLANQPSGSTTLAAARHRDLGVMINRPLNAFAGNRLVRLADVNEPARVPVEEIRGRIAVLRQAEKEFVQRILPLPRLDPAIGSRLEIQLLAADALDRCWEDLQGYDHWRQVRDELLLPRIRGALDYLEQNPITADRQAAQWPVSYRRALEAALQAVGGYWAQGAQQRVDRIKALLAKAHPDWTETAPLSRLAVRALRSTAGVSSVLVGMRREEYVDDVIGELQVPVSIGEKESAWGKLQQSLSQL